MKRRHFLSNTVIAVFSGAASSAQSSTSAGISFTQYLDYHSNNLDNSLYLRMFLVRLNNDLHLYEASQVTNIIHSDSTLKHMAFGASNLPINKHANNHTLPLAFETKMISDLQAFNTVQVRGFIMSEAEYALGQLLGRHQKQSVSP